MKHNKQVSVNHTVAIRKSELIDLLNEAASDQPVTIPSQAALYFKDTVTLEFSWKEETDK